MIPQHIQHLLDEGSYSPRTEGKEAIRETLDVLGIESSSQLGSFYLEYDPTFLRSSEACEELLDVLVPTVEGQHYDEFDPLETPVGMETEFVREVWEVPETMICFSTTDAEGAFLYDLSSGAVYDFSLSQQDKLSNGTLSPRWSSFFEFLEWYLD